MAAGLWLQSPCSTRTQSALPTQLPLPGPAENEDNGETNEEGDIVVHVSMLSDDSDSSELFNSD